MNVTTVVDMRKFVEARDGKAFTTTHQVALAFGKLHNHVLAKVRALECSDQFLTDNFSSVQFEHRGNTYEAFEMTKDGFMFLVMGFTGKSAASIKEGYIDAFNDMAKRLGMNPETIVGDLVGAVIGTSGEHVLDRVIDQKASPIPHSLQRSFKHTMKSRLRSRFNVQRTALIPAENLSDACNFVVAYALEGEWIGREISPSDKVKWSAQRWLQESPAYVQRTMTEMQGRGNMMLTPQMLFGGDSVSPALRAISELEKQGHDLEACRFEVQALKHHLEGAHYTIQSLQMLIERSDGKGVRFPMAQPGHAA
ncbi:putative antirepressor protein [Pseudomonas sp. R4-39-08]|nr:putative antirepressor protein [Pseudomonas sp. R4-39-08]